MIPFAPFTIARLPRIVFGGGAFEQVAAEARAIGRRALIVTGARSLKATPRWRRLLDALGAEGMTVSDVAIDGEPSPEMVDTAVSTFRNREIEVVIGIGGGSALDAAKAIAGMLAQPHSVVEHLEGLRCQRPYHGPAVPWIGVPTTAGTGSEATKNAVLSRSGTDGFKRSFRDEALVAKVAVIDPELLASCPPELIAANGMDAFTQLLESYTSIKANPLTDALAWSGLNAFRDGFFAAWQGGESIEAEAGRSRMAYASLMSGICLAQTGLGAVHGLASPLGAYFPIPHGTCCGTLVAAATAVNIAALQQREPGSVALDKYARVGALLAGRNEWARGEGLAVLTDTLSTWTERLELPRLSAFGVTAADLSRLVAGSRGSSMRTNPVALTDHELGEILRARL